MLSKVADEEMPPSSMAFIWLFFSDTFWLAKPRKGRLGKGDDVCCGWIPKSDVYRSTEPFVLMSLFLQILFFFFCWKRTGRKLYLALCLTEFAGERMAAEDRWSERMHKTNGRCVGLGPELNLALCVCMVQMLCCRYWWKDGMDSVPMYEWIDGWMDRWKENFRQEYLRDWKWDKRC